MKVAHGRIVRRIMPATVAVAIVAACCVSFAQVAVRDSRRAARLPAAVTTTPDSPAMDVAPVDAGRRSAVRDQARAIDRLVANGLEKAGMTPSPPLDDAHFVRRIHLDLAGRIPTHAETAAFLGDTAVDKRDALIERLLASPDYVSHFYNHWADVLRLADRPQRNLVLEPYLAWVKDSIRTNVPYDDWVREMLTADGRSWENPAAGYQLRDDGMPLPYVDNTVRVFLGTQIGCAQCHNHPFDDWTQHQFYELAAFTAGTKTRVGTRRTPVPGKEPRTLPPPAARQLVKEARETKGRKAGAIAQFIQANVTAVSYRDIALRLPRDYQYDDAKPLDEVSPKLLWGEVPSEAGRTDGREQFAEWVVARDNRQFARTVANRMWKALMGVGIVEPIDDFRPENPPSDAALLEGLTDLVLDLDFDLREFVRVVVSTSAYQRQAVVHDPSAEPFRFPGPALRRMTAEQIWDSIVGLIAHNPWSVQRPTVDEVADVAGFDIDTATIDDVERQFDAFVQRFGPNRRERDLAVTCGYQGIWLMKASEMPSPLPLGHFLRQFGQSDRETIDGARSVPTIPQILAMLNGPVTHAVLDEGTVIHETIVAQDPEDVVDAVFLTILSRRPTADERDVAREEVLATADPATGCGNVIWALLNTREFLFVE